MLKRSIIAIALSCLMATPSQAASAPNDQMVFAISYTDGAIFGFPVRSRGDVVPSIRVADARLPQAIAIGADGRIYVTHALQNDINDITIYAGGTKGNTPPLTTIAGPHTRLHFPSGITVDGQGTIYVTNAENDSITIYASGSSGDAAPIATISGSDTGLFWPAEIAVDSKGKIYVANFRGESITVYSPGSRGNAKPIATISGPKTGLAFAFRVALDPDRRIYVASDGGVKVYPADSSGDVPPIASISASKDPYGVRFVAVDSTGKIYLTKPGRAPAFINSLLVYPPLPAIKSPAAIVVGAYTELGISGAVALDSTGKIYAITGGNYDEIAVYPAGGAGSVKPLTIITSKNTGLAQPYALALGSDGKIYVANYEGGPRSVCGGRGRGSVTVYAPSANGDAAPIATFAGPHTGLNRPHSIAVDTAGDVYAVNEGYIDFCGRGEPPADKNLALASHGFSTITIYSAEAVASGGGNVAPVAIIGGPHTELSSTASVAVDRNRRIYATDTGPKDRVFIYSPGSNGDLPPVATIEGTSSNPGYRQGIALDHGGNIYVAHGADGDHYNGSISVYPAIGEGDVRPTRIIRGARTLLDSWNLSIAVDETGRIYVANIGCPGWEGPHTFDAASCIGVFVPGADGNVAPRATFGVAGSTGIVLSGVASAPPAK